MKLGDLTASHLGKTITIARSADTIIGVLTSVRHHAAVEETTRLGSSEPEYTLCGRTTTIQVLGWGERDYGTAAECEVR
jgi:hypothetical protein